MLFSLLRDVIAPVRCGICCTIIAHTGLCDTCQSSLQMCAPIYIDRGRVLVLAATTYTSPVSTLIRAKQYHSWSAIAQLNSIVLASSSLQHLAPDLLIPVPSHWTRQIIRGYNPADELAMLLGGALAIPCHQMIGRQRATAPQITLSRKQRQENVKKAFYIHNIDELNLYGTRHIVLIDDVMTTGATLTQIARLIRRQFPKVRISAVVAARVTSI